MRRMLAVIMSIMLLATLSMGMLASAEEAKTEVQGARWFPCEAGRENDTLWEVQFADGEYCGFTQDVDGAQHFIEATYSDTGALTIKRTGADGKGDVYWPNIRTLQLDNYPSLDLTVANTLYFDLEAVDCSWNMVLSVNGMNVKFSKVIADACGVSGVANSDADAPAGAYKGSVNLQDVYAEVAAENGTESCTNALAMQNMGSNTFVPQITLFYVGTTAGSLTINELFISTPEDTTGANCEFMDMGVIMGDDWYDEQAPAEPTEEDNTNSEDDTATTTSPEEDEKNDTDKNDKDDKADGFPMWIFIVGAVVVVIVVAVVIVVIKKKNA